MATLINEWPHRCYLLAYNVEYIDCRHAQACLSMTPKCPFLWGILALSISYMVSWAHPSPQPKRYLDRFIRFRTTPACAQQTDRPPRYMCSDRPHLILRTAKRCSPWAHPAHHVGTGQPPPISSQGRSKGPRTGVEFGGEGGQPPPHQLGGLGSVVSSPSGVRGGPQTPSPVIVAPVAKGDSCILEVPARGGSLAELLACWTQAQKGLGSNRSRDAVG